MSISCTALRSAILASFFFPWGRCSANRAKFNLHEQKDIAMLAKRLAACTRLSTTVSQLFKPQLQKNRHFYVPRPSFFVCLGDAPVAITQNVA